MPQVLVCMVFLKEKDQILVDQEGIVVSDFSKLGEKPKHMGSSGILQEIIGRFLLETGFQDVYDQFHVVTRLFYGPRIVNPKVSHHFKGQNPDFLRISDISSAVP